MKSIMRMVLIISFLLLGGCAQHRSIYVLDAKSDRPIENASVVPYPIKLFSKQGNRTDKEGKIKVFNLGNHSYRVSALGYSEANIPFPQNDNQNVRLEPEADKPSGGSHSNQND